MMDTGPFGPSLVFSKLVPHPIATYTQPLRLGNPRAAALPRAFVFCTEGKDATDSTLLVASRVRSAPGWRYRQLADSHDAPVNVPQETADVLLSLIPPTGDV